MKGMLSPGFCPSPGFRSAVGAAHLQIHRACDGQAHKVCCVRTSRVGNPGTAAVTGDIVVASLIVNMLVTVMQVLAVGRMVQHLRRADISG